MAYSKPTVTNMKYPHKSQTVTANNHPLMFILSQQVFEASTSSLTGV